MRNMFLTLNKRMEALKALQERNKWITPLRVIKGEALYRWEGLKLEHQMRY